MIKNWLLVQYTPGAGGKLLSDFCLCSGKDIARKINSKYNLDIDLDRADLLVDAWISHAKDFI
jgi:hypothetical protein